MDQSESSQGLACVNPRPFVVEVTELVYACVNLKLRYSPLALAWVAIYPKKHCVR